MTGQSIAECPKVLVVEDEMMVALLIEDALCGLGAQVVGPAARLDAALRLANEACIDAAILDVNIRGGNSYPVADILAMRGIPFIFCSGYGDWALDGRHRDRPYLAKPYSSEELELSVIQMLGVRPN